MKDSSGNVYQVHYNDAGGMHSGNFWTWLIKDYIIFKKVSYSGYVSADTRYDIGISIENDGLGDYVDFIETRYGDNVLRTDVR